MSRFIAYTSRQNRSIDSIVLQKGDYVKVRRVSKKEDGVSLDYGEWIWGIIHHAGEYTNDRVSRL